MSYTHDWNSEFVSNINNFGIKKLPSYYKKKLTI